MELDIKHKPAAHCENGTIASLLSYYGINLSEPMIFGLASGLFFTHMPFIKMGGMPVTSFRTFPGVLFKRITKELDIKTKTQRFLSAEKAMLKLDALLLERNTPVGCVVGMYYLPYIPLEYRFHFNGHNICVIGKDNETNEYRVIDTNTTQKVSVSYDDLVRVRFAKGGTYPLYGQMYWIESVPKDLPELSPIITKSIKKTCNNMISWPHLFPFIGAHGIIYLSNRLRTWEKDLGFKNAILNLAQLIRMMEEIGTGGAGFRFIYGAFLQESAEVTGIKELNDFSKRITKIGDSWRKFSYIGAQIIKQRDKSYTFDDLADLLYRIGNEEKNYFKDLKLFIND